MRPHVVGIVMAMFAATYVSRALPLVALSRARIPPWLEKWLSHVPVAVLASLAASSVLVPGGTLVSIRGNVYLLAAVPTLVVAARTRSLVASVVAGMLTVTILRALL